MVCAHLLADNKVLYFLAELHTIFLFATKKE